MFLVSEDTKRASQKAACVYYQVTVITTAVVVVAVITAPGHSPIRTAPWYLQPQPPIFLFLARTRWSSEVLSPDTQLPAILFRL